MKEPKLSKESARAFVARFAANVKERMESQEVKASDLGRAAYPESPSPNSAVYNMLHAAKLPSDEVMAQVAKALNCTVEALHHGELEQYKGSGRSQKAEVRSQKAEVETGPERRGLDSTHFRKDRKPRRTEVDVMDTVDGVDMGELYGFVLDAVCACAVHLAEPRKGQYIRELARTCRKYQAAEG